MITANQTFSIWGAIFPDRAITIAAINRLVHHATIFEMNVESYRRWAAYAAATSASDVVPKNSNETDEKPATPPSDIDT